MYVILCKTQIFFLFSIFGPAPAPAPAQGTNKNSFFTFKYFFAQLFYVDVFFRSKKGQKTEPRTLSTLHRLFSAAFLDFHTHFWTPSQTETKSKPKNATTHPHPLSNPTPLSTPGRLTSEKQRSHFSFLTKTVRTLHYNNVREFQTIKKLICNFQTK